MINEPVPLSSNGKVGANNGAAVVDTYRRGLLRPWKIEGDKTAIAPAFEACESVGEVGKICADDAAPPVDAVDGLYRPGGSVKSDVSAARPNQQNWLIIFNDAIADAESAVVAGNKRGPKDWSHPATGPSNNAEVCGWSGR